MATTTTKTLVIDPICGMQVDPRTAAGQSERDGETFYFCSPMCKERFDAGAAGAATQSSCCASSEDKSATESSCCGGGGAQGEATVQLTRVKPASAVQLTRAKPASAVPLPSDADTSGGAAAHAHQASAKAGLDAEDAQLQSYRTMMRSSGSHLPSAFRCCS